MLEMYGRPRIPAGAGVIDVGLVAVGTIDRAAMGLTANPDAATTAVPSTASRRFMSPPFVNQRLKRDRIIRRERADLLYGVLRRNTEQHARPLASGSVRTCRSEKRTGLPSKQIAGGSSPPRRARDSNFEHR